MLSSQKNGDGNTFTTKMPTAALYRTTDTDKRNGI